MKVMLALETAGGGSGLHVLDLAEGLAARGCEVTVAWSPERAEPTWVRRLQSLQEVSNHPIPMSRSVSLRDWGSLRALIKLVRSHGPFDVLHGHSSKAGALVRLLPRSVPGARIYTPHAFRTMDPEIGVVDKALYSRIESWLSKRGDGIICVGSAERQHASVIGIPPTRLHTVLNGTKLAPGVPRNVARAQMQLKDDDVAVGFVGRLAPQKDPLRFVEAINLAHTRFPAIRGIVFGDGELRQLVEDRANHSAIQFLGWCDAASLMAGLDIYAMTSRYEAYPYTLLEAIHRHLPIVMTDVGGAKENLINGGNGTLLPMDASPLQIADAIVSLAADPKLRLDYSLRSAQLAKEASVDRMVSQTMATYEYYTSGPQS